MHGLLKYMAGHVLSQYLLIQGAVDLHATGCTAIPMIPQPSSTSLLDTWRWIRSSEGRQMEPDPARTVTSMRIKGASTAWRTAALAEVHGEGCTSRDQRRRRNINDPGTWDKNQPPCRCKMVYYLSPGGHSVIFIPSSRTRPSSGVLSTL
ncbi:hypothetical protein NDU88_012115 [Pleurodeles waltl]|uniref:Uncharacterized protein n=1 Tax=Pleurodeles waltl TaxID=8319 RepID=A0AAV7R2D2_PLEWA|nr:hypothetical protein NDU88_012115 [Pleurodeles waltl]